MVAANFLTINVVEESLQQHFCRISNGFAVTSKRTVTNRDYQFGCYISENGITLFGQHDDCCINNYKLRALYKEYVEDSAGSFYYYYDGLFLSLSAAISTNNFVDNKDCLEAIAQASQLIDRFFNEALLESQEQGQEQG